MKRLRDLAGRLALGSALLGRRYEAGVRAWVLAGGTPSGRLIRAGLLLGVSLMAARIVRAVPALLWPLAARWCWLALREARQAPDEPAEEPPAGDPADAIRALLWQLIGDGPGVHLRTVLAHLQEHGHHTSWTVADLRRHLERHSIPVDPKLKLAGTPTRGVRRDALGTPPPAAAQAPSPSASTAA